MKKAFVILFVLISTVVCATPYIVVYLNTEKVHIEYELGYEELEINGKIHILAQLLDTLLQQRKDTDLEIYLFFESGIGDRDSSYYTVSFGKFEHSKKCKQGYYSSAKITTEGLKFVINDRMLNISQILNFVNASIEQLAYIKANQKETFIKKRDAYGREIDTLYSIPASEVKKYLTSKSKIVDNVLKNKIHRIFWKFEGDSSKIDKEGRKRFDYFFQNGKFYFYNISTHGDFSERKNEYAIKKFVGRDTLIVDNVFEIFFPEGYYHHCFIFTNDSTFYYLPPYPEEHAKGAFVIRDMALQRPPILRYNEEYDNIRKITLYLDGSYSTHKAMFIPDSNVVISNYGDLEYDMIHKEIAKNKAQPSPFQIDKKQVAFVIILFLSLLLNLWLWQRKK